MVADDSEDELTKDRTGERDRRDILAGGGLLVCVGVDLLQQGVDGADNLDGSMSAAKVTSRRIESLVTPAGSPSLFCQQVACALG